MRSRQVIVAALRIKNRKGWSDSCPIPLFVLHIEDKRLQKVRGVVSHIVDNSAVLCMQGDPGVVVLLHVLAGPSRKVAVKTRR
jgi:hypothetical protein